MSHRDFARQILIKTLLRPEAERVRANPRALHQVLLGGDGAVKDRQLRK